MDRAQIEAYFDDPKRQEQLVQAISRLVRIRSVREDAQPGMPFGPGPAAALAEALALCGELGLSAQNHENYVGTADLNKKETRLHILGHLDVIATQQDVQFVWQTGKYYDAEITARLSEAGCPPNLKATPFISDMATAYAEADLVISRAGAGSISEFCLLGKPVILVPSPNVAEDHQTQNAMALVRKEAAICVRDAEARDALLDTALQTVRDDSRLKSLAEHIHLLAKPHAAREIAEKVIALAEGK